MFLTFVKKFIHKHGYILLLLLTEFILFYTNYAPGTYLVGWDNVFPELNFSASLERNITAIWQQYRGLGVIDGMAHASLLPHTILVYLLSLIFPQNFLRYLVNFSLHLAGGIGVYLLIKKLLSGKKERKENRKNSLLAFIGALFYQFNLVTVQMFFTPLEVFSYHFAALPWLLYSADLFIEKPSKLKLLFFIILSFITLPQAHVPSVFLVYFMALIILLFFRFIASSDKLKKLKNYLLVLFVVFATNSFWAFPYAYMTKNNSQTIIGSKINQISTENVVLRNKAFGDFLNVALMKGFTLDYIDYQPDGTNNYMMLIWRNYQKKLGIFFIGLIFFLLQVLGSYWIIKKKKKNFYPFIVLNLVAFSMLGFNTPGLSVANEFLKNYVPLFYNVFRFVFTKFSILYAFSAALLLVNGIDFLLLILTNFAFHSWLPFIFMFILAIYSYPAFQGQFLYPNLRVAIPSDYFRLMDYFSRQSSNVRIATLPQPSFWGWVYYQWGVRGSGFLWYGIGQPTLEGAFYPWSRENENYYWEMAKAVYARDKESFDNILDKYQIGYLIVDQDLISPFSPRALQMDNLLKLVDQSNRLHLIALFGHIRIYKVIIPNEVNNFILLRNNLPKIAPTYKWNDADQAFSDYGYYSSPVSESAVYYPFRSLFSNHNQDELEFKIDDGGYYYSLIASIPQKISGSTLFIPPLKKDEFLEINEIDISQIFEKYPQIYINGKLIDYTKNLDNSIGQNISVNLTSQSRLEIRIPKIYGIYSLDSSKDNSLDDLPPRNCEQLQRGVYTQDFISDEEGSFLRLKSINTNNCLDVNFPEAFQRLGYLVKIEHRNIEGSGLDFTINNRATQRADLETYLPVNAQTGNSNPEFLDSYFIIPPMADYSFGYSFHIDNESIGSQVTINDLKRIVVNPIPYRFLKGLKFVKPDPISAGESNIIDAKTISVFHNNPFYYRINFLSNSYPSNSTLILSQSFDRSWQAYWSDCTDQSLQCRLKNFLPFKFLKPLNNHLLVNNWENGWSLDPLIGQSNPPDIILVYLPQYLEYLGFALWLFLPFTFLLVSQKSKKRHK